MSVAFAQNLVSHGDAVALITETGERLSYIELGRRVDAFGAQLGAERSLVLLEVDNSLQAVVALLACFKHGHPIIPAPTAGRSRIEDTFDPNLIVTPDGRITRRHSRAIPMHDDLALLMSTSGTTGATKLVRLSAAAVQANAASIAEYLAIGPADRAITSLPISYSYGLSVLNSHLFAGGSVVLTGASVVDEAFLKLCDETGVTSMAGVPYTYELLESVHFRDRAPVSLRTMTQAGGRLDPALIARYHQWAEGRGVRFFVMYGQTEATARIAYLPPRLMDAHSDCIGVAIPGGTLRLLDEDGRQVPAGETGELTYAGPNVMMGYASTPQDLSLGAELSELRTGDLGQQVQDGLFRIVGRKARFSKIAGLRVSLDQIETMLHAQGMTATVAGDDSLVTVAVPDAETAARAEQLIDAQTAIPMRSRIVVALPDLPRLSSGKIDYPAILAAGRERRAAEDAELEASGSSPLLAIFARALNRRTVTPDDSFVSLAGDSLAFIEVSMAVERAIGELPDHWERLSIAELDRLAAAHGGAAPRRSLRVVTTEMLIRPVAITAIIMGHIMERGGGDGSIWKGGSLVLLMIAGYNAVRFQRAKLLSPSRFGLIRQFFLRYLILFYMIIVAKAVLQSPHRVSWTTAALIGNYVYDSAGMAFESFWFIEVLFQLLLMTVAAFSIPAIRRMAVDHAWGLALAFLGIATAIKFAVSDLLLPDDYPGPPHRLDGWAYAFALGWAVAETRTTAQRLFCLAVGFAIPAIEWGLTDPHAYALAAATAIIMFVPRVRLWGPAATALAFFAQATFYIYLSNNFAATTARSLHINNPVLLAIFVLAAGMGVYVAWRAIEIQIVRLWSRHAKSDVASATFVDAPDRNM